MKPASYFRVFGFTMLLLAVLVIPQPVEYPIPAEQPLNLKGDVFSGVPAYFLHETASGNGYTITVHAVTVKADVLQIDVDLSNTSQRDILLTQALRLYGMENSVASPNNIAADEVLKAGASQSLSLQYTLAKTPIVVTNYRLMYMPLGYSGIVFMYFLVERPAGPIEPPPPNEPPGQEEVYGVTGDPWKMLVLIYRNIDTDYIDSNNVTRHLTASMPAQDLQNMKAAFLNLPHRGVVFDYSGKAAELEAQVVVVNRPLTSLTRINDGYYPSPDVTGLELRQYIRNKNYDSVIVFWQASDPATGQSIPDGGGWGWGGYWNNMTYATVYNLSWVWTTANQACHGEVFLHEWLHGVTGFYMSKGVPFNVEDLHGAEEATSKDYVTPFLQTGCWEVWLRDYMRGLVYENGVRKALVPARSWYKGSLTTYTISGWRGEYFNNQTLSGIPVLVRDDPNVNFDWQDRSPHPFVLRDGFSARWTKSIKFEQGKYKFSLFRDDGIRLKIDGVTVLDKWTYGREWVYVTKALSAGWHTVRVESYEIDGYAAAMFRYIKLTPPTQQHLKNNGFNSYTGTSKIPTSWLPYFATTDGKDAVVKQEGSASVKLTGMGGITKTISQYIVLSGASGNKFTFSYYVKGSAIPATAICLGQVTFYNGTKVLTTQTRILLCQTGTYAFQKKMLTFTTGAAYTKILVKFSYNAPSGTVWFDAASLVK